LIAAALKIPENKDRASVIEMAKTIQVPSYVPKKIKVELPPGEENKQPE